MREEFAPRPLDAALRYAERGWPVFPCHGVQAGVCSCRMVDCSSPGKHPRVSRGLHAASSDPDVVARWWTRWPGANIGLRTGAESGLVVLDVDPAHGGGRSIKELIDRHGDLSAAPRVRTGSGGWHLFFAHPGEPIGNSAGRLGLGLDVRGDGGYVIAPPSSHRSGAHYRWELDDVSPPELPDSLAQLLVRPARDVTARAFEAARQDRDVSSWARAALDAEISRVSTAPPGSRNATLNRSAFSLGQIVGAGLLDESRVEDALVHGGIRTGLSEREAVMTVRSGLRAGTERPRGPALTSGRIAQGAPAIEPLDSIAYDGFELP